MILHIILYDCYIIVCCFILYHGVFYHIISYHLVPDYMMYIRLHEMCFDSLVLTFYLHNILYTQYSYSTRWFWKHAYIAPIHNSWIWWDQLCSCKPARALRTSAHRQRQMPPLLRSLSGKVGRAENHLFSCHCCHRQMYCLLSCKDRQ